MKVKASEARRNDIYTDDSGAEWTIWSVFPQGDIGVRLTLVLGFERSIRDFGYDDLIEVRR